MPFLAKHNFSLEQAAVHVYLDTRGVSSKQPILSRTI